MRERVKTQVDLKKEIINNFGSDYWDEITALEPLERLNLKLCKFLGIDPIPIQFEKMKEDARYYLDLDYIGISDIFVYDEIESIKSLIHEIKHLHQKYCISHKNEEQKYASEYLIKQWEADFKIDRKEMNYEQLQCMTIEVDAFAFTKYILKKWYKYDYHHSDKKYDVILQMYIDKYYI